MGPLLAPFIDNLEALLKMNGLVYVAEKLKGQKLTAVITMTEEECMRSELAKVTEKLL